MEVKDKSINDIVQFLQEKIGAANLFVMDHWEGDLCAIGLTNKFKQKLVYISTYNKKKQECYIELETSSNIALDEFEVNETIDNVNINDLEKIIRKHLTL